MSSPIIQPLPPNVRQAALERFALGEDAAAIARSIGVAVSTVTRWAKRANVTKGSAVQPDAAPLRDKPAEELTEFEQLLKNKQTDAALAMFLDMQDGTEDKYRVLMAQKMYAHFFAHADRMPALRTWTDWEKAHKIMMNILNPDAGKSRGASRLDIQFNVISDKPATVRGKVVDAEEVTPSQDDGDDGSGD